MSAPKIFRAEGAAAERGRIVAWLRAEADREQKTVDALALARRAAAVTPEVEASYQQGRLIIDMVRATADLLEQGAHEKGSGT